MRRRTSPYNLSQPISTIILILWFSVGCRPSTAAPTLTAPVPTSPQQDPSETLTDEERTLNSLEKVDDYPLYTMRYYGAYSQAASPVDGIGEIVSASPLGPTLPTESPAWGCSLFAALGNSEHMLYGRNFDWEFSPAILLFADPPDGYASVSMVDMTYLGITDTEADTLLDLPLDERRALLSAPSIPFDGMNERGLAIGMAAVPPGNMQPDPGKQTIDSVAVIREMLDHASNVDEALAIIQSYNIDMAGGPPLHYLIADVSGRALLIEFYQGELVVFANEQPWHLATNFLRASTGESAAGQCERYDMLNQRLTSTQGQIALPDALDLLSAVSQDITQWSILYEMSTGDVTVVMGRQYDHSHAFHLSLADR